MRNFLKISIRTIGCPIVLSLRDDFGGSNTLSLKKFLAFHSNPRKLIQGYLAACTRRVTHMLNFDKFVSVITLWKLVFHLNEISVYL